MGTTKLKHLRACQIHARQHAYFSARNVQPFPHSSWMKCSLTQSAERSKRRCNDDIIKQHNKTEPGYLRHWDYHLYRHLIQIFNGKALWNSTQNMQFHYHLFRQRLKISKLYLRKLPQVASNPNWNECCFPSANARSIRKYDSISTATVVWIWINLSGIFFIFVLNLLSTMVVRCLWRPSHWSSKLDKKSEAPTDFLCGLYSIQ